MTVPPAGTAACSLQCSLGQPGRRGASVPTAAGTGSTQELLALAAAGLAEPVVSKQGMFCHVLVRAEPSAGLLLHVGNTGVIIIKFVP